MRCIAISDGDIIKTQKARLAKIEERGLLAVLCGFSMIKAAWEFWQITKVGN